MALKLSNNANGILAMAISNSATSLTLRAGHGSRFPALGPGDWFPITVVRASDPMQLEIMRCTARSGDTLTVVRAQEGTSAITFSAGDVVELRLTSGTLEENFPQVEGRNAKNLSFSIDSVGGKPELKFKSGGNEETVVRRSDLTTSPTDTTTGRLLKVGDFGVGAPAMLPEGTDLNTFTTNGSYDVKDAVNRPEGTVPWGFLRVIRHSASNEYCYQEWTELSSEAGRTYYRVRNAGNWSPWREFYHTGNLALPIGVGQTWQDVTNVRNAGVTYTNTTGRTIFVAVGLNTSNAPRSLKLFVGGVMISQFTVSSDEIVNDITVNGFVPPGSTYRFGDLSDAGSINWWRELR